MAIDGNRMALLGLCVSRGLLRNYVGEFGELIRSILIGPKNTANKLCDCLVALGLLIFLGFGFF